MSELNYDVMYCLRLLVFVEKLWFVEDVNLFFFVIVCLYECCFVFEFYEQKQLEIKDLYNY